VTAAQLCCIMHRVAQQTQFNNDVVRLSDLAVVANVLKEYVFEDCLILGPAVVMPLGSTSIVDCDLGGKPQALLWIVEPDRDFIIGSIGLKDCSFRSCAFQRVGFAGPEEFRNILLGAV
jgi:hypothetical protein